MTLRRRERRSSFVSSHMCEFICFLYGNLLPSSYLGRKCRIKDLTKAWLYHNVKSGIHKFLALMKNIMVTLMQKSCIGEKIVNKTYVLIWLEYLNCNWTITFPPQLENSLNSINLLTIAFSCTKTHQSRCWAWHCFDKSFFQ